MFLEGEKSTTFTLEQGVAQGCSLSPILFSVFIDDLLREVEKADLGIQLGGGKKVGGMLFADDNKWRLRANVCKSAVMVFSRNPVEGEWKWGEHFYLGYPITLTWVLTLHVMGPGTCISKRYAIIVLISCIA